MNNLTITLIRSDGQTLILGGETWGVTFLSGIDAPNMSVYSENLATEDGNFVTGKRIGDRTIKVKSQLKNRHNNNLFRNKTVSFFNPKKTYKFIVKFQGTERWINCELDKVIIPSAQNYKALEFAIDLYCANPFFKSMDNFGKNLASEQSGFAFPYIDFDGDEEWQAIKPYASVYNFASETIIVNNGDVDTFCIAVIEFTSTVTNPKITKDSGFVRVVGTFEVTDVLVIDFEKGSVEKNGINVSNMVDRMSTFYGMALNIGDNTIGYDADDGQNAMDVTVYYNNQYLGV